MKRISFECVSGEGRYVLCLRRFRYPRTTVRVSQGTVYPTVIESGLRKTLDDVRSVQLEDVQ